MKLHGIISSVLTTVGTAYAIVRITLHYVITLSRSRRRRTKYSRTVSCEINRKEDSKNLPYVTPYRGQPRQDLNWERQEGRGGTLIDKSMQLFMLVTQLYDIRMHDLMTGQGGMRQGAGFKTQRSPGPHGLPLLQLGVHTASPLGSTLHSSCGEHSL